MAGVGKLLKQAAKMQKKMEALQEELSNKQLEISSGGGAINIVINGQGEFQSIALDPEFLKEEKDFVEETLLEAVKDAAAQAKAFNEEEMGKVTEGFQLPGMM